MIGIGIWQRPQQDVVDDREHHRRGADADSEHEDGDRGEAGHVARRTQRVPCVLDRFLDPARASDVPALFLQLLRTAERQPRPSSCLRGLDTVRDEVGGFLVLVEAELALQVRFQPSAVPQSEPPVHAAPPSVIRRISPTAVVRRFQLAVSVSSCAFPLRVRR